MSTAKNTQQLKPYQAPSMESFTLESIRLLTDEFSSDTGDFWADGEDFE